MSHRTVFQMVGAYPSSREAIACGIEMAAQGADIIDVGGESTRPGSERVRASEQKRRVIDVIAGLREELPETVHISIDTTLSEVARAALDCGATMLNDVSAGRDDPDLLGLAADANVPICLMHMLGEPATMQRIPSIKMSHGKFLISCWSALSRQKPRGSGRKTSFSTQASGLAKEPDTIWSC